jgi:hypothetical protein
MSNPSFDISKFGGEVLQVMRSVFKILKPYGSDYGTILQAHFRNQV